MGRFYILVFIVLLNVLVIDNLFAQSGRVKQEVKTNPSPQIEGPTSDAPPRKQSQIIIPPAISTQSRSLSDHMVYEMILRLAKAGWSPEEERGFSVLDIFICRKYRKRKFSTKNRKKPCNQLPKKHFGKQKKLTKE